MSISDTVKKVMPYLKTASGYVLHRLSSQAVEMDDGTTLEQKVTSLNSLISNKVDTSDVVNNCLTTEEGFVLDARQGKVLDDKITELIGNMTDAILVKTYAVDNITVPAGDYKIVYIDAPVIPGYARTTWIVDISNASSGGKNMSGIFPYHYEISTGNAQMRCDVKNTYESDAKIKLSIRMTYTKTALFGS